MAAREPQPPTKTVLLVEGKTEQALKTVLKDFLDDQCTTAGKPRVRLETKPLDSRLLKKEKLGLRVKKNLERDDVLGVVALVDVVAAGNPFKDAAEAIEFLRSCHPDDKRYRCHAAQHDFEAWLLPYWDFITKRVGVHQKSPGNQPENVNHDRPPSKVLEDLYQRAKPPRKYNKPVEALAILRGQDLLVSAKKCPQFAAFLQTLLDLADCTPLQL